jgi:hypothetical protein
LDAGREGIAGIIDGPAKLLVESLGFNIGQVKVHAGYMVTPLTNAYAGRFGWYTMAEPGIAAAAVTSVAASRSKPQLLLRL